MKIKMVADWQELDEVYDTDGEPVCGLWVGSDDDTTFIEFDNFIRYGTMWIGDAPECVDESGNKVIICATLMSPYMPYYIEIDDKTQMVRVWEEVERGNIDV